MKFVQALFSYVSSTSVVGATADSFCKCTPASSCWPSTVEWSSLNKTLHGALIQGVAPASVCYPDQPNYNKETCEFVASQWFNSTWHATNPVSIDYPIWSNNSCNPIWPNGTSITGDTTAGARGCSIGAYPTYVVNATTPKQVSVALKWASKKKVRIVIKNTGHSYTGRSIGYGSLSIWTHHFRNIEYIKAFKPTSCPINDTYTAVRVAAGHTGIEVQTALAKVGAITVTGANPDVGLIGWLTGGGHGALSRSYGLGADNLLEATVVTPDGRIHLTNPCQDSDLFFAVRGGGGGTYGVVTSVVVRTFPSPKTTSHVFQLVSLSAKTSSEFWALVGLIHAEMPRLKEGGMQGYYFIAGLPIVPTLSLQWTFMLYDKPDGTVEALLAPLVEYLKTRTHLFAFQSNVTHADSYLEVYRGDWSNELVANGGSTYGSRLLSPRSLADGNVTARILREIGPSDDVLRPNGPVINPLFMGHFIAPPDPPTYYPSTISLTPAWRNTLMHFIVVSAWPDGVPQSLIDAVYQDITHNKTEPLRKLSPETGAYFNEADANEPEWQDTFFGANYKRLKMIKEKYDPGNVLWCRRCVGSEALVEKVGGRLCRVGT